jgi:SAM-dependent methyltransferase
MKSSVDRGYQEGFFLLSEKVRDPVGRHRKGLRMLKTLQRHSHQSLAECRGLDIGCSSGLITAVLAPYFRSLVGLEFDVLALRAADPAERAAGRFVRGDAMTLPFGDNSLDVVVCAQVYEHVPDDRRLADEIYRVLAPGGVVLFSGPNWLFPIELHYRLPFVHWLPSRLAARYLQVLGRGDVYYERARHLWGLQRLLNRFVFCDITLEVLRDEYLAEARGWGQIGRWIPDFVWSLLEPWFPSFNFILYKPMV